MKELKGTTITAIFVSDDEQILSFKTRDHGQISYEAEGDCCSTTWFADIIGVHALIDHEILEVTEVKDAWGIDVKDERCREEDILYKILIKTTAGYCDIIFRNSSNGYYGGEIGLYKGKLPENMKQIIDDWQA